MLTHDLLSRHLWVLQLFKELIQAVCFSTLSPLPHLVRHQRRQAASEHLKSKTVKLEGKQREKNFMQS